MHKIRYVIWMVFEWVSKEQNQNKTIEMIPSQFSTIQINLYQSKSIHMNSSQFKSKTPVTTFRLEMVFVINVYIFNKYQILCPIILILDLNV
jgi:hypothetical protein